MSVGNWVFPRLQAKVGAWRRYWVQLVVMPDFYSSIILGTPLEGYALHNIYVPLKWKMVDPVMRASALKSKKALKALQNGAEVRDIPGMGTVLSQMRFRYQEAEQIWTEPQIVQNIPFLVERLSAATMSYTYSASLEARLADRLLGSKERELVDRISFSWLSASPFQYLNQQFHPQAQHYRVQAIDDFTLSAGGDSSLVDRSSSVPRSGVERGDTCFGDSPYVVSYVGPLPPVPDPQDPQELLQLACTLNLFDVDWPGSPEELENVPVLFDDAPAVPFERVYQVDSVSAWVQLVQRYPLEYTSRLVIEEFNRVTGASARFMGVDWRRVRTDFDVVHFGFNAVLDCSDVALSVDVGEDLSKGEAATVMYRVVPGSTMWLNL